jgi:hypothetical protein
MVPAFFSSAKERIVIAGIKNKNTQGAIIKRESIFEYPLSSTFKLLLEPESDFIHHMNKLINNKNTPMAM